MTLFPQPCFLAFTQMPTGPRTRPPKPHHFRNKPHIFPPHMPGKRAAMEISRSLSSHSSVNSGFVPYFGVYPPPGEFPANASGGCLRNATAGDGQPAAAVVGRSAPYPHCAAPPHRLLAETRAVTHPQENGGIDKLPAGKQARHVHPDATVTKPVALRRVRVQQWPTQTALRRIHASLDCRGCTPFFIGRTPQRLSTPLCRRTPRLERAKTRDLWNPKRPDPRTPPRIGSVRGRCRE